MAGPVLCRKARKRILWVFTGELFGIAWFIDIVRIANGTFRDKGGLLVLEWD